MAPRNAQARNARCAAAAFLVAVPGVALAHGETLIFTLSQFVAIPVVAVLAVIVCLPWGTRGMAIALSTLACFATAFVFDGNARLEWQFGAGLLPPIATAIVYIAWSIRAAK
jgi:hypothetical protein